MTDDDSCSSAPHLGQQGHHQYREDRHRQPLEYHPCRSPKAHAEHPGHDANGQQDYEKVAGASGHACLVSAPWARMRSWAHDRGSAVTPTAPAVQGQLYRCPHLLGKSLQAGDTLFRRRVGAEKADKPVT